SFLPVLSPSLPPDQAIDSLGQVLDALQNLSPSDKQNSMAEILINGKSSQAGIELKEGDQ
ncbi:MAG TPA: hypothetical protein DCG39_08985, partial [Opitutae bacterium]|nr:hypothetical protein [Opitutae bacterium]